MHGPCGNNPDQLVVVAKRKGDMKQPSGVRLSQGVQPEFTHAVADVLADQQGIVEEDLLSLALADLVLFDARGKG
jgi:hypothetical protein